MSSLSSRLTFRDRAGGRNAPIGAIDIGSSKIVCMIARRADPNDSSLRVVGSGHMLSKGVKTGVVTDMAALERTIRLAVEKAETAADVRLEKIVIGIAGAQLRSQIVSAVVPVGGKEIAPHHVSEAT